MHWATKETTHRQSSRWNKHETRVDFSSYHKQRSRLPCDVSDADNLIALYNASRRHIILTYIFLLPSAPDLLSSMLSPAPSPPVRLQRQWEVAYSCGPGAPAHIWSSEKKKPTLLSWCYTRHGEVEAPLTTPETFSLVLFFGFAHSTGSHKCLILYFFHGNHKHRLVLPDTKGEKKYCKANESMGQSAV